MEHRVALLGCGNVGKALVGILARKRDHLKARYGVDVKLTYVGDIRCGSTMNPRGLDEEKVLEGLAAGKLPDPFGTIPLEEVIRLSGATIVADATPTNLATGEPGLYHARSALSSGAHFVTTSKGPFAVAAAELEETAKKNGLSFRYEGAVMSGTPLIRLIREDLAGCSIESVEGILNGTTNYMLSRMEEGLSYDEALREAQDLGYAEADPTADVEGFDPAVKLCVLSWVAFGVELKVSQVDRTGISGLTSKHVQRAKMEGRSVKLIASIHMDGGEVKAKVSPVEVPREHPLFGVRGALNAATITTDHLGKVTISGPGAGRDETAQALLSDIISVAKTKI
ncbi:homoserine dehydrogenase [Thermanaerovibrio velox DSM 12556]|uniref:Homoserine dehydrogenase n=1 Tax=Thermanaerovibrio velox DSM 12556 TaxID=926567 RepID=H0UNK7_9BACT|nr:homoserine dehydrogenase [Thermanaerovibrio velox]EHM10422.1 homoserine dehydrogenase [Thermanaerovibrio velox DSM 12556]